MQPNLQIFPAHRTLYIPVTENKFIIWNYSFSGQTGIYLFEFSNNENIIICEICSKLTIEASDIVPIEVPDIFLVYLILT